MSLDCCWMALVASLIMTVRLYSIFLHCVYISPPVIGDSPLRKLFVQSLNCARGWQAPVTELMDAGNDLKTPLDTVDNERQTPINHAKTKFAHCFCALLLNLSVQNRRRDSVTAVRALSRSSHYHLHTHKREIVSSHAKTPSTYVTGLLCLSCDNTIVSTLSATLSSVSVPVNYMACNLLKSAHTKIWKCCFEQWGLEKRSFTIT